MNNDLLIDGGLAKLETKYNDLLNAKPVAYSFKSNCRYNDLNIKTLSFSGLQNVLTSILSQLSAEEKTKEILKENGLENHYDDSQRKIVEDIMDDVIWLMKKLSWESEKKTLEDKRNKLKAFYSDDKKTQISLEALLSDL